MARDLGITVLICNFFGIYILRVSRLLLVVGDGCENQGYEGVDALQPGEARDDHRRHWTLVGLDCAN